MTEYPNYIIEKANEIEKRDASDANPFAYNAPEGLEHIKAIPEATDKDKYLLMACLEKLHEYSTKSGIHQANTRDLILLTLDFFNEHIEKLDLNDLKLYMAGNILNGGVEDLLSCIVATIKSGNLEFDELHTHGPDSGLIKLLKAIFHPFSRNYENEVFLILGLLSEHLRQQRKAELIVIYQSIFDPLLGEFNTDIVRAIMTKYGGKRELIEAIEDLCLAY